ncbi:MAG: TIGR00268 family protein [bacterium]
MAALQRLLATILAPYSSLVVCLSGGLDSCLLLKMVHAVAGGRVRAVTFISPLHTTYSINNATTWAATLGIEHLVIDYDPLDEEGIQSNGPERCYRCKARMFSRAREIAGEGPGVAILDGSNAGDDPGARPGMRANREFGILSPWRELGLGKHALRLHAQEEGIPFWERPADSCLATRLPPGHPLKREELAGLEHAEDALRDLGLSDVRVRPADDPPRVLIGGEDYRRACIMGAEGIVGAIRARAGLDLSRLRIEMMKRR